MELLDQLNRAMDYIEEHIRDDLALGEVSRVTSYSTYHFGRLFYYIADMPLSEYVRKRKLSLAAMDITSGHERVIDIALRYGYDSADSFSRAFVKQHGVTPSTARKSGVVLKIFAPMTFQIKVEGVQGMNWRIEQKEAFEAFGIERRFGNDESDLIPGFCDETIQSSRWKTLTEQAGRDDLIGVCSHIDETRNDFSYMIGLFKDDGVNTDGFTVIKAPATTWAVFRSDYLKDNAYGTEIPTLFKRAYSEWLPASGYEKAPGHDGEVYDMEIYGVTDDGKYYEEVWLSVIKKG